MPVPLARRHTQGRIFGTDWSIENVAKLLRSVALESFERAGQLTGTMYKVNQDYLRQTSARHLPTCVTVSFRRDAQHKWKAELCFADLHGYLPWDDELAEKWLTALFLEDRPRVRQVSPAAEPPSDGQPELCRYFELGD